MSSRNYLSGAAKRKLKLQKEESQKKMFGALDSYIIKNELRTTTVGTSGENHKTKNSCKF